MKGKILLALCLLLSGCGGAPAAQDGRPAAPQPALDAPAVPDTPAAPGGDAAGAQQPADSPANTAPAAEIDRDGALARALENADVPAEDAYNIQAARDEESGIPIFQVEFETEYGDYAFEIERSSGRIIGADCEVDEEWLDALGGSPVDAEGARRVVQDKVPGAPAGEIRVRQEDADGRGRWEGELFFGGFQYEIEIDARTGIVFDWNADLGT